MATCKWVTARKKWCDLANREVELMERRVYPADTLPSGTGYRVVARKCSAGLACNLAGFPCKWAYTNPCCDRMELA